jgi:hypothetical protein
MEASYMATVKVEITDAEQSKRRRNMERARLAVESEGLKVPAETLALGERYIAGEIEIEDALRTITDRYQAKAS